MQLFRTFPWLTAARKGEPGHPLHTPPHQRGGRVDNPQHYRTLYLSSAAAGAIAEVYGTYRWWTDEMFVRPDLPGSVPGLGSVEIPGDAAVCDLDDAATLARLGLRPSDVVTRRKEVTQRWALRIHEEGRWVGVRWWSYYDPRWHSYALWDRSRLSVRQVEQLSLDHPALVEASEVLRRPRGGRSIR